MSMEFNDDALIAEFVTESRDHLSSIEPDLLILEEQGTFSESNASDLELINRIFRAIHSIKGASGFFGFEHLKRLSHVMENLLMLLRDGQMAVSPQLVEALLLGVDKLNALLEDITLSDTISIDEEVQALDALLNPTANTLSLAATAEIPTGESPTFPDESLPSPTTTPSPSPSTPESHSVTGPSSAAPAPKANKPLGGGTRYVLEVDPAQHLGAQTLDGFIQHLNTFGEVLSIETQGTVSTIILATVLDLDLVILATDLPESQVRLSDTQETKAVTPKPDPLPSPKPQEQPSTTLPAAQAAETSSPTPPANQLPSPAAAASKPESKPEPQRPASKATSGEANDSIRVRIDLLNKLMELAGEMVLSRNQLLRTLGEDQPQRGGKARNLDTIVQNIDLITTDLQEHIMQTRMQPIGSVFGKFPRIVRDMAKQLGKEINLITQGEDVELDKSIIESLSDPLTHLIRNCCDHGLEPADEREELGKPRSGAIRLRAFHQDGQINISITDDGRGIDTRKLVAKALDKNLITEEQVKAMAPSELANLIFLPGLSTAEKVSDISGRGVGMDVVKTNITRLGGQIQIDTTLGLGTELLLRLPLTLAIIPSLIVGVAGQRFAVPQVNLVELLFISAKDIPSRVEKVGSATVLRLRRQLLPLLKLSDILELNPSGTKQDEPAKPASGGYNIMVLRTGNQQFGVIVDELFDTEEIVVKSLSGFLKECRCFSGATIMGDGHVAMILDPNGIVAHTGLSFDAIESEQRKLNAVSGLHSGQTSQNMLLFNNAPSEVFAIPLVDVLRLEKFSTIEITRVGHREFINYDGKGLPIIRLESYLPVAPVCPEQTASEAYLVIPKKDGGKVGIVVSKVLDITETDCEWKPSSENTPGIAGWAVLQEKITVRLDLPAFLANVIGGTGSNVIDIKSGEAA